MKKAVSVIALLFVITPAFSFATCSSDGYSIIFVNGIFTASRDEAESDTDALRSKYSHYGKITNTQFHAGYNESHLAGAGDLIDSVFQTLRMPVSEYDLDTILKQVHGVLSTRKVLLVGHSQGSLYTNEMYAYLITHGVASSAVAVYNIATPAHEVAGHGDYLTSRNDGIINRIRAATAATPSLQPLPGNITISIPSNEVGALGAGHLLQDDYLAGAGEQIVRDIDAQLARLNTNLPSVPGACFEAPDLGLAYGTQRVVLTVADPAVDGVLAAVQNTGHAVAQTAVAVADGYVAVQNAFNNAVANAWYSIFPRPNAGNAGIVLDTAKALYGSSLASDDLKDLLAEGDAQHNPFSNPRQDDPAPVPDKTVDAPARTVVPKQEVPPATPSIPAISPTPPAQPYQPGFGGGAAAALAIAAPAVFEVPAATSTPEVATTTPDVATSTPAVATSTPELASSTPRTGGISPFAARDIVINEVAWGGTSASSNDDWIELKTSSSTADLSNVFITNAAGTLMVPLAGTVTSQKYDTDSYYLITRTANTLVSIQVDKTDPALSFSDVGDQILLVWSDGYATTTIDQTPAVATCNGWCSGERQGRTMERNTPTQDGLLASSWHANDRYKVANGVVDANNQSLAGTPGRPNSFGWPEVGMVCQGDQQAITEGSVYVPHDPYCTLLAGAMSGLKPKEEDIFLGEVGNATLIGGTYMGREASREGYWPVLIDSPKPSGPAFIALYPLNDNLVYEQAALIEYLTHGTPLPDGDTILTRTRIVRFTFAP